jgi:hypothetical protein
MDYILENALGACIFIGVNAAIATCVVENGSWSGRPGKRLKNPGGTYEKAKRSHIKGWSVLENGRTTLWFEAEQIWN